MHSSSINNSILVFVAQYECHLAKRTDVLIHRCTKYLNFWKLIIIKASNILETSYMIITTVW
ncbi:hypothetical protein Hanom_Chr14g01271981 [Helianthus anomalus]